MRNNDIPSQGLNQASELGEAVLPPEMTVRLFQSEAAANLNDFLP
jgi:hypothetical protein